MSHPLHNMACTEETAVLIHQLPEVFTLKIIKLLESHLSIPPSSVKSTKATDMGVELYLDGVVSFEKVVRFGTVKLFSTVYKIYPLATDLTVHGARAHMTQEELKSRMKHFGTVLIAYEEKDLSSNEPTNNYRVTIRHPEIPEEVEKWTESSSSVFGDGVKYPISFFCRFCRSYDHARVQCKAQPAQVTLSGAGSNSQQSKSLAEHKVTSGSSSKKCNPTDSQSNNSNDCSTLRKTVPRQEKSASFPESSKRCNSDREKFSKNAHQYSDLPMKSVQNFKRKSVSNHKSVNESESKKLRIKGGNMKGMDLSSSFPRSGMDYIESLLSSTSVPAIPSFIEKKPNVKDLNTKKSKDITSHKKDQSNEGTSISSSNARDNTPASFNTASIAPKNIIKFKTSPKYLVSGERLMALYKIIKNRASNERRKNVSNLSSEKETLKKTEQRFINDEDVAKCKKSLESITFNKPKEKLAKKNCELNFRRTNSVPIGSDNSTVYTTPIPKIVQEFTTTDKIVTNFKSIFEQKICKTEDKIVKKNCDFQRANSIQSCSESVPLVSESKNFSSLKMNKDAKVKNTKAQESSIEGRDHKPQNTKELENVELAEKRKRKISKNPVTSKVMNDILDNSNGELTHSALRAFFVQVTNRKKPLEIARNYSANVHLIIWQLKCLVTSYYNGKERDSKAEGEIRWIKRLIERMEAGKEPQNKVRTKITPVVCHTEVKMGIKQEAVDY